MPRLMLQDGNARQGGRRSLKGEYEAFSRKTIHCNTKRNVRYRKSSRIEKEELFR